MTIDPDKILAAFEASLRAHDEHTWEQIGRCVYCADCQTRLYQGRIPTSHTQVRRRRQGQEPKSTTAMRERWGKT
jgi:hypothetical protein